MTKVLYKGKEVDIKYRNDVIFKKTLADDDENSRKTLSFLLSAITHRSFVHLTVLNSEMISQFFFDKKNYLDIRATDEHGHIYQIELQLKNLDELQLKRIQQYGYRPVSHSIESGVDYDQIKNVYQIIFTTGRFNGKLVSEYRQREDNGKDMPCNLVTFYIISLPYIEDIVKERRELSDLEVLSYVYQKEVDDDIMDIANPKQKEVLEIMNEKMRKMLSEDIILDEAVKDALYEQEQRSQLEYARNEGKLEGSFQTLKDSLHRQIRKIYQEAAKWIDDCTKQQLEQALDFILDQLPYQQFKDKVLKNR